MSSGKKFISLWVVLIIYGIICPWIYLKLSLLLDGFFHFPGFYPAALGGILGATALIIGVFWITWGYSFLHFVGKGSPIEAFGYAIYPTQNLVASGPYAYTRNPMVLGMLFVLLAIAFFIQSIGGLILIPLIVIAVFIYIRLFEEPALMRRFGDPYKEYMGRVPALFPRFKTT